ncbi:MAG: hypothetical protein AB7E81_04570 [Hyphomicrobiaceae bacterium]|jgi:hypothetical protein
MTDNHNRAERAGATLDHYGRSAPGLDPAERVTDLVADIGHFCTAHDLAFLYLLERGIAHWRLEMTGPQSPEPPPDVTPTINESNPQ